MSTSLGESQAASLCQYLPSDFIFFSTHCGEVTGSRITQKFPSLNGAEHTLTFDLALSISPIPLSDKFQVIELFVPIAVDGVSWSNHSEKKNIKAGELLKEFLCFRKEPSNRNLKFYKAWSQS